MLRGGSEKIEDVLRGHYSTKLEKTMKVTQVKSQNVCEDTRICILVA